MPETHTEKFKIAVVDTDGKEFEMLGVTKTIFITGRLNPAANGPSSQTSYFIGDEKFKELGEGAFQSLTSEKLVWDKRVVRKP